MHTTPIRLTSFQGVRHKILAFEMFLNKYPEYVGKVRKASTHE